jgi:hypothetical protein
MSCCSPCRPHSSPPSHHHELDRSRSPPPQARPGPCLLPSPSDLVTASTLGEDNSMATGLSPSWGLRRLRCVLTFAYPLSSPPFFQRQLGRLLEAIASRYSSHGALFWVLHAGIASRTSFWCHVTDANRSPAATNFLPAAMKWLKSRRKST